ncbi:L-rhamnose mutarotase [Marinovum sp. 2_MG-2023]|uniref:L-rhamnose mutarotase n=1 Tax=unclassified Marinovum TaxID=2647166 RepID=UPI0026E25C57|nr:MULTISPECIES: L-rhamnose mutarotase [unclassified Marinovum]MDO6732560.1 L-rhamnose mutarotase [Marinovum sp. 2_MG-2023]MDO6781808.1 L-rhamnose mutarotase [Marinovum sp. 1_MG-2023]
MTQRMGFVIGIKAADIPRYKELHADVWPDVLTRLKASNITNYSIFLREPENLMFGYWEYTGSDFAADMAAIGEDPVTREWWAVCGPMQSPLDSRKDDEWWAGMEHVFYLE